LIAREGRIRPSDHEIGCVVQDTACPSSEGPQLTVIVDRVY
jgi:hypothetical protein